VASGQRTAKSGGRPEAKRSRRGEEIADVSWPGSQAGGATTSQSGLKSLTQIQTWQHVGRSCYEAEDSAAQQVPQVTLVRDTPEPGMARRNESRDAQEIRTRCQRQGTSGQPSGKTSVPGSDEARFGR
jgi:hypothetical protein